MTCWFYFVAVISAALYAARAQPGDRECLRDFPDRYNYPAECKVLFDSYRFRELINLYSTTGGQSFSQAGGVCSRSHFACSIGSSSTSCLYTPYISYMEGQEIFYNISYDLQRCGRICKSYVTLFIYDQNSQSPKQSQTNHANYVPIQDSEVSSRIHRSSNGYQVFAKNRTEGVAGFNLKFQDDGICGSISRLMVYYRVCPERINGLVRYNETSVPPRNAPNSMFQAACAPNSHNVTSLEVSINSATSICTDVAPKGAQCECNGGFYQDNVTCEGK